jgi:hypothetical protein
MALADWRKRAARTAKRNMTERGVGIAPACSGRQVKAAGEVSGLGVLGRLVEKTSS